MRIPGETAPPAAPQKDRRPLFPLSLRTHLILISIVLTTGPVVIFGLYQAHKIRATQIESLESRYRTTATSIAREIDFFISDATDNLQVLASAISEAKGLDARGLEAHVRRALDTRTIDHIAVMTRSARSIVNVTRAGRLPVGTDYRDRPYIRSVIAARGPQLSAPLMGRVSRRPEVFIGVPVLDRGGALKAILVGGLDMTELRQRHLSEFTKMEPQSRILLLDATGRPVVTSDRTLQEVFAASGDARITPQGWEGDPRLLAWTDEQRHLMVGARASLETWKWIVLSGIPEAHIREAMATPIRRLGYASLWLLLACAIASPFVARIMSAPILALQRQAKRIANGALGEQVSLAPHPPGELVDLSSTFNTMSARLARKYREAEAFTEISLQLSSSLDPQMVFLTIAHWAKELCSSDLAAFAPYDPVRRVATITACVGARTDALRNYEIIPGSGADGRVLETGELFVTDDYFSDPLVSQDCAELARAEGFVAKLAVPVRSRNRTIGVLWVINRRPVPFTPQHQEILQKLATHASVALENARLHRETQDRVSETETLLAVGEAVSSTLDLQELLRRGARELARAVYADTAGAYLVAPTGQELYPFAGYHLPKEQLEYLRTTAIPIHWNRFVLEAFTTRRAAFSSDVLIDPRFGETVRLFSIRAVVMVPFMSKEEITGCLFGIWWNHPHTPTPRDLELAEGIGRQLALAVENSRLHKESLDRAEALAVSEDRYRRLAEGAKDIIFAKNAEGRFTYLNPRVEEVLGYRPEELLGRPAIAYVVPRDHKLVKESFAKTMRGESDFDVFEIDVIKKDGSTVPLEVAASAIYDAEGRVIGRQEIARDLTERRRLEEEVRERKRLEEINQFKSQFLANMSHELRTPLNSVIGFSEILQDPRFGPLTEKQVRFANNILLSGRHLLALIEDILDLAKIEAGKMRLHLAPFEVARAISEACSIIQHQADAKQQSLTTTVDPAAGFCIADHQRLHQILLNLLHNAIKFTPDGGQITVSARRARDPEREVRGVPDTTSPLAPSTSHSSDFIEIAVIDTGIGVSQNDLPRLFREFEQLEPFDTKNHEGTGLGLALCRRLVELHGGKIWASSAGEGRGSTFTFTIPAAIPTDGPGDA